MQITNSAYLAVECMAHLTGCTVERPGKTLWLARAIQRSVSYTEALMSRLRNAGLVVAKKGSGGGYVLSRPADQITIAQIFAAFDEPRLATGRAGARADDRAANDSREAAGTDLLWDSLRSTVLGYLTRVSLADVTSGGVQHLWDGRIAFGRSTDGIERPSPQA
ncbi:MAG: Rrf2 family transcriptional regulator [Rhodospirillales bacterium]|nr:MAG: Rrf2 family transcriptional regulator [Rhodospirillales bacterium]